MKTRNKNVNMKVTYSYYVLIMEAMLKILNVNQIKYTNNNFVTLSINLNTKAGPDATTPTIPTIPIMPLTNIFILFLFQK